ncbi:MAG TPA: hypothetical protein VMM14_05060 [Acidimicrobiia bacterium]|nr:hypothetical protein [Acidimicrobiia bacterium]
MKLHKFDSLSFIAGLVITLIGLAFLLLPEVGDIVDVLVGAGSWLWPVVLIAAGIAVLAPMASRSHGSVESEEDQPSMTSER